MRRLRFLLRAYYLLPLLAWLSLVVLGATSIGRYETTWGFLFDVINLLAPQTPPITTLGDQCVSMYKLNEALRSLLHITAFGVVTALTIRAVQGGQTRLKVASVGSAVCLAVLFILANAVIMSRTPGRHTGLGDWVLDGIGVTIVLGGSLLVYALRDWAANTRAIVLNDLAAVVVNEPDS